MNFFISSILSFFILTTTAMSQQTPGATPEDRFEKLYGNQGKTLRTAIENKVLKASDRDFFFDFGIEMMERVNRGSKTNLASNKISAMNVMETVVYFNINNKDQVLNIGSATGDLTGLPNGDFGNTMELINSVGSAATGTDILDNLQKHIQKVEKEQYKAATPQQKKGWTFMTYHERIETVCRGFTGHTPAKSGDFSNAPVIFGTPVMKECNKAMQGILPSGVGSSGGKKKGSKRKY